MTYESIYQIIYVSLTLMSMSVCMWNQSLCCITGYSIRVIDNCSDPCVFTTSLLSSLIHSSSWMDLVSITLTTITKKGDFLVIMYQYVQHEQQRQQSMRGISSSVSRSLCLMQSSGRRRESFCWCTCDRHPIFPREWRESRSWTMRGHHYSYRNLRGMDDSASIFVAIMCVRRFDDCRYQKMKLVVELVWQDVVHKGLFSSVLLLFPHGVVHGKVKRMDRRWMACSAKEDHVHK